MPSATVAGLGTVTVDGAKPFTKKLEGGRHGAFRIFNAAGLDARPRLGADAAPSVFVKRGNVVAQLDALLAALNA